MGCHFLHSTDPCFIVLSMGYTASAFSRDYHTAREKFRQTAEHSGFRIQTIQHHQPELTTDVAILGPDSASQCLITTSGVHGVEGFAGSAIQIESIKRKNLRPNDNLKIIHVHALNPYGFHNFRRVNEDNVDLNRNFIDWTAPAPQENPLTCQLNHVLSHPGFYKSFVKAGVISMQHGLNALKDALTAGQYSNPKGMFYGGNKPSWSHQTWNDIWHEHVAGCDHAAHIDIHTGLGGYGWSEIIYAGNPLQQEFKRASDWWGKVTSPAMGTSSSSRTYGDITRAFNLHQLLDTTTSVTLEFGTLHPMWVFCALLRDHHAHLSASGPAKESARTSMQQAFNPQNALWQTYVLARGCDALIKARHGLLRISR